MKHRHFTQAARRLTALTLALLLALPSAYAAAGSPQLRTTRELADGLTYSNTITSHSAAGRVESFSLELEPGAAARPILLQSAGTVYGAATINKAVSRAESLGYHVLGAINTDFFATSTGVPMGIVIEDGDYQSSPENEAAMVGNLYLFLSELMHQAAATVEEQPTDEELDRMVEAQMETLTAQLAQKGLTLEAYCQFTGSDEKKLREDMRPDALEAFRTQKAVEKIAQLENLTVTDEEMDTAIQRICADNHMSADDLKPYFDNGFLTVVRQQMLRDKATEVVRRSAQITQ